MKSRHGSRTGSRFTWAPARAWMAVAVDSRSGAGTTGPTREAALRGMLLEQPVRRFGRGGMRQAPQQGQRRRRRRSQAHRDGRVVRVAAVLHAQTLQAGDHAAGIRNRIAQILVGADGQETAVGRAVFRVRRLAIAAVRGAVRLDPRAQPRRPAPRPRRRCRPSNGRGRRRARSPASRDRRGSPGTAAPGPTAARVAGRSVPRGRRRCSRGRSRRRDPESRRRDSAGRRRSSRSGRPHHREASGDTLATCSISSLKLTAPALNLDAEDLADHPAQQPLEARVGEAGQRAGFASSL